MCVWRWSPRLLEWDQRFSIESEEICGQTNILRKCLLLFGKYLGYKYWLSQNLNKCFLELKIECKFKNQIRENVTGLVWMLSGYDLDVIWMRSGCSLDAVWMQSGCGLDAVWMRSVCGLDAVWMRSGCSRDAVWMWSSPYKYIILEVQGPSGARLLAGGPLGRLL